MTGAGQGIGRAVAERLAGYGINVLLAGLTESKLTSAAAAIEEHYGVSTRTFALDLTDSDAADQLLDYCHAEQIEVDILINNAGVFIFNDILDTSDERVGRIIALHITTLTAMCRLFGAEMVERGDGRILNMASYSIWMPLPGIALYSATKAYIRSLSIAFGREVNEKNVWVTAVSPAGVATDLYGLGAGLQRIGTRLGVLYSPRKVARKICRAMFRGRRHLIPGVLNRVAIPLITLMPPSLVRFIRRKMRRFEH